MGKDWGSAAEEGDEGEGTVQLNTGGYSASVNTEMLMAISSNTLKTGKIMDDMGHCHIA